MNYTAVGAAALGLLLIVLAAIMPYWLTFPMVSSTSWPVRNWGLLKISGRYSNVMMDGADLTWIQVRDSVCSASQAWTTGSGSGGSMSNNAMGMATAIGAQIIGANCGDTCKQHLALRCQSYYKFTTMGFVVFGLLIAGGLASLVGAGMPLIGKERKKDRATWLSVELLGFLMAGGACALHWFIFNSTLFLLRQSSWYAKETLGWAFFLACVGAAILLVPVAIQLSKILGAKDAKKDDANTQLLTGGASPEFMMPSAI